MKLELTSSAPLPTRFGDFTVYVFQTGKDGEDIIALSTASLTDNALVRLHSECATGDIFSSLRCDCRTQLEQAQQKISEDGNGLIIYIRGHEGRGIGLANKIKAYALQDQGHDTVDANLKLGLPADARTYESAAAILNHFGLKKIRLLTNNTRKISALENAGITVTERVPAWTAETPYNREYLQTKKTRMGHLD